MKKTSNRFALTFMVVTFGQSVFASVPKSEAVPVVSKASKNNSPWSVGLRAGTLGFGAEGMYKFNDTFALRAYASSFLHERETLKIDKVKYKHTMIKLLSGGVIADWFFLKNGFKVSGGVVLNGNKIRLHRDLSNVPSVTIEGVTLPGAAIGYVRSHYRYHKVAPYVGVGYDSPKLWGTGFSLALDLGVLCQGKAKAHPHASGPASASPVFRAKLKRYARKLVNDYQALRTYPVINIGLRYTF